jgi:hypothetical protein
MDNLLITGGCGFIGVNLVGDGSPTRDFVHGNGCWREPPGDGVWA